MQDLDWPFNPQPGLCHFIQSSPGIREKHSTNLRLIVLIHSTFFRERHLISAISLWRRARSSSSRTPFSPPLMRMTHRSLWIRPHPRFRPKTALQKTFIFFIARCVFLYILSPMPLVTTCTEKPWLLRNLKNLRSRFLGGDKSPNWGVGGFRSLRIFPVLIVVRF